MLYQAKEKPSSFYWQVPPADTVIYIMIDDHYRRNFVYTFWKNSGNYEPYIHYKYKDKKLILDTYKNNFIKASYIYLLLHHNYICKYISNPKHKDILTEIQLAFLTETRKYLKAHWKKDFNFVVILYQDTPIKNINTLKNKLIENGFIVIDTKDLTKEDLLSKKYLMKYNNHPNEAAWDLLTPLIVKELKNKNVI